MCGIVAVVRRRATRTPPDAHNLLASLEAASILLTEGADAARLAEAAATVEAVDRDLRGVPGLRCLLGTPAAQDALAAGVERLQAAVAEIETALDRGTPPAAGDLEAINATLIRLKDALWAIGHDRLRAASEVRHLAGDDSVELSEAALAVLASVHVALSAIDRLEVRGRDSAGLHLMVTGHGLDFDDPAVASLLTERTADALFTSGAVRIADGHLSLVYKAAAEIGELGDNTAALRASLRGDRLLRRVLQSPAVDVTVVGHTRWASVGIISQANAHPLNSDEEPDAEDGSAAHNPHQPSVVAALNGDVDNYADLRTSAGLRIAPEITTDAKVIPVLVSRRLAQGAALDDAFRETVASFEGSVAIVANTAHAPERVHLALKGSGQGLYVGLAEDAYVVTSEPYGLVEETSSYVRLDGESTGGQIAVIDRGMAGRLAGIRRWRYDGAEQPLSPADVTHAEITTRDIDRGGFAHFLLKEITQAPQSFRKTLRGKIREGRDGLLSVVLGDETLPPDIRRRLGAGSIRRILVVGQGTAAVAGQGVAAAIQACLVSPLATGVVVRALPATELSGFHLVDDMADTLVVAVSQSGTTTDTNRTVDLVRSRGAAVIGIVNRRNSDLVAKADGILYTSDGRDVEMAVPSTKAFYVQVASGWLLGAAIAECMGACDPQAAHSMLSALRQLPEAMERVLAQRPAIADAARLAPARRYWAVVGNGNNRIAAEEIRIKLSELCYKSIACDATEDKKHIDLAAEPLIFVCAAGLAPATASDVAKEVAIYRSHRALPIVVASEGHGFGAASSVITVPEVHPELAFVLAAMAGHLFGYEAALCIDAQARPLREVRAEIEAAATAAGDRSSPLDALSVGDWLAPRIGRAAQPFFDGLAAGAYNGHLEASTAVRLAVLLRYAIGVVPIEAYESESGRMGTPAALLEDLTAAVTAGIDELTRPIDAIKHQAKTVTVGISRSEEAVLGLPLVRALLATGARRDHLSYRALRTLAALDPAVEEVTGYTRYGIEGPVPGEATVHVIDRGGVALGIKSRTEDYPVLRGTKHRAAEEREVTVARGRSDGRTLILVPEIKDNQVTGLDLLHVRFAEQLAPELARTVLRGYRNRYAALVDAVTETEPVFDDAVLGEIPMIDLLNEPVYVLADRWKRG